MYHIFKISFLMFFAQFSHGGSSVKVVPDGTVCYAKHELRFFCVWGNYGKAKKACEDDNSYLVKIDNANISEAVSALIDKSECKSNDDIYIGAKATPHPDFPNDGSKRIWRWLDGSEVFMPLTDGYQNWQPGQPNDVGSREDCLILDIWTRQWKDSPCGGTDEVNFYICQKNTTLNIKVTLHNEKLCIASAGPCAARAEWRRNDGIVASSKERGIYQTQNLNYSVLHEEMATIGDAGRYVCVTWLDYDKTEQKNTSVEVFVNGTPTIFNINTFACNSSIQVEWEPDIHALGYLHRIRATSINTSNSIEDIYVKPNKTGTHVLKIVELESSSEYNVEVVACINLYDCPSTYAAYKTVTTRGEIVEVSNAMIQQTNATYNDTCVVTWVWPGAATFQINLHSEPSGSTEKAILNNTGMYSFYPISGQAYTVVIQPLAAENICPIPVDAVGSCVGRKVLEENNPWKIGGLNFMIVVPSAAVGVLLLLLIGTVYFWKRTKTPHQQVDNEINPGCPVPTDYGHLHSSSNQDEVDAEGSSDGAVVYSTAADPQSFGDGPIYASVYNPKIQVVVKEDGSNEMNRSTGQTSASTNTESMVINPIYDMEEASTSAEKTDAAEASFNDSSTSANAEEDQELATEDPIYTAVNKVKMKNDKTVRRTTDEDE